MIKKIFALIMFFSFALISNAVELEDLNTIKPYSGRLGVGDKIEDIKEIKSEKIKEESVKGENKEISAYDMTYADISIKKLALDVLDESLEEQEIMLQDLSDMWGAVASNSETMQYTIYKLSNPDENKPDENVIKKIIKPVASFSTLAGTAFSANPFVASGALIGGNLLNAFVSDNKQDNYQFTKVSDADMVILVRKIDDLQKKLMNLYIDYKTKKKIYEMASDNTKKREAIYKKMQNSTREQVLLADTYLRNAQNLENKARSDYQASRNILEQLVGTKVLGEIEKREKKSP